MSKEQDLDGSVAEPTLRDEGEVKGDTTTAVVSDTPDSVPRADDEDKDEEKKDDDSDSGKQSVESDESSFHASDYENDSGYDPDKTVSELLLMANEYKTAGNELYQAGDLVRASRSYKKGISLLKPMFQKKGSILDFDDDDKPADDDDDHVKKKKTTTTEDKEEEEDDDDPQRKEVKAMVLTLSNNLSMICLQQNKPKLSRSVAHKALKIDRKNNVKTWYRHAMAQKALGNVKEARNDLKEAYRLDPNNATVKKELHALITLITTRAKREKKAAKAVFSFTNKTMDLYDDKMEEERKKKEAETLKKKQEEEALAKRRQEWDEECAKRKEAGQDEVSYEDWDKARKKREKAERKAKRQEDRRLAEEKKAKELERKRKEKEAAAEKRKADKAKKESDEKNDDTDDEDALTEAELAQFRGYRKTADGKTTTYFARELPDHAKELIGDTTPRRLDENGEIPGSGPTRLGISTVTETGKGKASAWNAGGTTWEEKNATDWCSTQLKFRLNESISKVPPLTGVVKSVNDLVGEASVAVAGGRKRYIFDYHCNVDFDVLDEDVDEVVASGKLRLPDINSANHDDVEVEISVWTQAPTDEFFEKASECRQELIKALRVSVLDFVKDFNGHY